MAHAITWHVMGKISILWMPWHGIMCYTKHIGLCAYMTITQMVRLVRGKLHKQCTVETVNRKGDENEGWELW